MNKSLLLVTALAVGLTGTAFANTTRVSAPQVPASARLIPSKVVNPTDLPRTFSRSTVNIEFSLDETGQPRDIKVLTTSDEALKRQVVSAFSQWKFDTAGRDLGSTSKRFVLPLEIVPGP